MILIFNFIGGYFLKKICSAFKWFLEKFDEVFSLEDIYFIFSFTFYLIILDNTTKNFENFTDYQKLVAYSLIILVITALFITPYALSIKKVLENKDDDKR